MYASLVVSLILAAPLAARPAVPWATGLQPSQPVVRISLNSDATYRPGDRARVHVRTEEDGHLVILRTDVDGWVRVLFPADPFMDDFIRGGQEFEVRDRGDRDAFRVSRREGTGVVLAVFSTAPFDYSRFTLNDHWDYRALDSLRSESDPQAALMAIADAMAGGASFDYDVLTYTVGERPVSYYYPATYYYYPGYHYPYYRPYYRPYYGRFGWSFSIGFGYWPYYRSAFYYDPFYSYGCCYGSFWYSRGYYRPWWGYRYAYSPYRWNSWGGWYGGSRYFSANSGGYRFKDGYRLIDANRSTPIDVRRRPESSSSDQRRALSEQLSPGRRVGDQPATRRALSPRDQAGTRAADAPRRVPERNIAPSSRRPDRPSVDSRSPSRAESPRPTVRREPSRRSSGEDRGSVSRSGGDRGGRAVSGGSRSSGSSGRSMSGGSRSGSSGGRSVSGGSRSGGGGRSSPSGRSPSSGGGGGRRR